MHNQVLPGRREHSDADRHASFLHLLVYSLSLSPTRLIGSAVVMLLPVGYLLNVYFTPNTLLFDFFHSPAEGAPTMFTFIAAFSLMPAQALADKTMKLALLGPYKKQSVLLVSILSTLTIAVLTMLVAITLLSIVNYYLTYLDLPRSGFQTVPPPLSRVVETFLQRYSGLLGFFSYITLFSFACLTWGARIFGETVNMLASLVTSFFIGAALESMIMSVDAAAAPYTFTFYMYALGSFISGLNATALGYPNITLPAYQIWFGIIFTISLFVSLAWLGFRQVEVRME